MQQINYDIEILSAPSILGLKPTGVENLGESLLKSGLAEKLGAEHPVIHIPTLNILYDDSRDSETKCLNAQALKAFSLTLDKAVSTVLDKKHFTFVLGGDCSILIGIMAALKTKGTFGLIFLDAHADFYAPEQSPTGQVADMELAVITGRGPELLTNINELRPYVEDKNVVHVGQRDQEECYKYGSADIRDTAMQCFELADIEKRGIEIVSSEILQYIDTLETEGFWIHFDTDVLSDEINPAVDYRLPGGLQFEQVEYLLRELLLKGKMAGISVTIFNPELDLIGLISRNIAASLGRAFDYNSSFKME